MDDLMELSDKKKLAEFVMGWSTGGFYHKIWYLDGEYVMLQDDFDPLDEHYWDILEAMTPEQRHTIQSEFGLFDDCCFNDALWINNKREAVMNALLDVI